MIATSFIVSLYLTSLVFQLITIYLSIKLLTQAHIYRIPCLFLIFGFLFMTVRRIYPLIEIHQGGAPNVLDALTALVISALMMVGMHFMGKAFLSIEAQSSIYEHGSKVDGMTGALRKQETFVRLEQEISRSFRNKEPLALIMFDIDHFKYVNDRYGHLVGDLVLKNLVSHCQSILRDIDLLGRVGAKSFWSYYLTPMRRWQLRLLNACGFMCRNKPWRSCRTPPSKLRLVMALLFLIPIMKSI